MVADALLLPVDGALCRLGGAPASALRAALDPAERADELAYVSEELLRLRPLAEGAAHAIEGVARWQRLVVSAAYPHDVDGRVHGPEVCAAKLRHALPNAFAVAARSGVRTLALTVIGTRYRLPADLAVRAQADAISRAPAELEIAWSLPEPGLLELAREAATRLGLPLAR